jgi:O-antigen/teichoic acid export membrane protein
MDKFISKSFINISLRGLTLISKFIFIFLLGKYAEDEFFLGEYGIIVTSISLIIYLVGFDYYVFNTREILKSKEDIIDKIRNQFFFHLIVYLIVLPVALTIIFYFNFIDIKYFLIILLLIISEHLGQELFRLYTTLEKSNLANFFFFIKSGLWVWLVLFDFFVFKNELNLFKYLLIWASCSWFSMIVSMLYLKRNLDIKNFRFYKPDYSWIIKGVRNSSIFFISSLSFLVIQFSDRFMIDLFYGKKMVGVYSAYSQFVNAIDVFVFSAIIMVMYPKLIKLFSNNKEYSKLFKKFKKSILVASVLLIVLGYFVSPLLFGFLEKPSFITNIKTFNMLLIGVFFLLMSYGYHYDLYIKKKDTLLLKISLFSMSLNVILNLYFIPNYGIFGASLATMISFFILFILKLIYSTQKIHDSI